MKLDTLRADVRRYGLRASVAHGAYAVAERAVGFKALRGMTLRVEHMEPKYLGEVPPYSCHRATAQEFAALPAAAELAPPTFFTLPQHRGRQLHAYGMAHAAAGAVADGYEGLISYVEIHNHGSLHSVTRLGYRSFGTCFRARILGKTMTFSSSGCEPYEFRLVVPREGSAVRPVGPTDVLARQAHGDLREGRSVVMVQEPGLPGIVTHGRKVVDLVEPASGA